MASPKILTEHDPHCPWPELAWIAYYEGDLGQKTRGCGKTEEEAIADLKELYPQDDWE